MLQLEVVDPNGTQWRVPLTDAEYIIGRNPQLAIALKDRKVSRRHARLYHADGFLWVEDLGSSNGVVVDGLLIREPTRLTAGTHFEISGFRLSIMEVADEAGVQSRFRIVGHNGPTAGQTYNLTSGQTPVGRGNDNVVVIDDPSISRHHAVFLVSGDTIVVEDLHSSNGTFLNNAKVTREVLEANDDVRFGNVAFGFQVHGKESMQGRSRRIAAPTIQPIIWAAAIGATCCALLVVVIVQLINRIPVRRPSQQLSKQEKAYEDNLKSGLTAAQDAFNAQAWDGAIGEYHHVLDADPINVEARAGLSSAELNREHQTLLAEATTAMVSHQPAHAISRIAAIGPQAYYGNAAEALADKARSLIAHDRLASATKSCKKGEYRQCQEDAAVLLTYLPQSIVGLALIEEAEDGLRSHRTPFTAWNPASSFKLAMLYPDNDVREALLSYGAGDMDTAIKKLKLASRHSGGADASATLNSFRRAKTTGDGAAAANDLTRALKAWGEALADDAKLLNGSPSVFGSEVRNRMATELLRLGATAFDRGAYVDAFNSWHRGAGIDPQNGDLAAALAKLEARASNLLTDVVALPKLGETSCARLRDIVAMTRRENPSNKAARERLALCR